MKKIMTLMLTMVIACVSAMGQSTRTIHGFVIDTNGNPIAGAEVTVPGGGDTAITDSDGSFTITVSQFLKKLTAKYAGMANATQEVNFDKDMVFTMKPENMRPFFLNAVVLFANATRYYEQEYGRESHNDLGGGVMFGQFGKWGWFGKLTYFGSYNDHYAITGGVTRSLKSNKIFAYLGLGYGLLGYDYEDYYWEEKRESGIALDAGLIFKTSRHFDISVGFSPVIPFSEPSCASYSLQIGVGYVF